MLEENPIFKCIKNKILKLNSTINSAELHYSELGSRGPAANSEILLNDFRSCIKESEELTVAVRSLPELYPFRETTDEIVGDAVAAAYKPVIGYTEEGYVYLRIPRLPSIYSSKKDSNYIKESIYYILNNAFGEAGVERHIFGDCVIVYCHRYARDGSKRRRNNDTSDTHSVTDVLSWFILNNSSGSCYHYYMARSGEEDCTEVFVVPREEFTAFITKIESGELDHIAVTKEYPDNS